MKDLNFAVEDGEVFADLYAWFSFSAETAKGLSELRLAGKILEKFESAGLIELEVPGAIKMNGDSVCVSLEDAEFNKLRRCVEATEFRNMGAKRGIKALEFLERALNVKAE